MNLFPSDFSVIIHTMNTRGWVIESYFLNYEEMLQDRAMREHFVPPCFIFLNVFLHKKDLTHTSTYFIYCRSQMFFLT